MPRASFSAKPPAKPAQHNQPSQPKSRNGSKHSSKLSSRLKITSQMAVAFRHIKPTWREYIQYVDHAASQGDKEMQKILAAYLALPRREQLTIYPEQLCDISGVRQEILFGAVCTQLWNLARMEANVITAIHFPKVMERTAKQAITKHGVKDREMFHKGTGFLPTPQGPTFNIGAGGSVGISGNPQTQVAAGDSANSHPAISDFRRAVLPTMEEEVISIEDVMRKEMARIEAPKTEPDQAPEPIPILDAQPLPLPDPDPV